MDVETRRQANSHKSEPAVVETRYTSRRLQRAASCQEGFGEWNTMARHRFREWTLNLEDKQIYTNQNPPWWRLALRQDGFRELRAVERIKVYNYVCLPANGIEEAVSTLPDTSTETSEPYEQEDGQVLRSDGEERVGGGMLRMGGALPAIVLRWRVSTL